MVTRLIVHEDTSTIRFLLDRGFPEQIGDCMNFESPFEDGELEDLRWYLEDYLTAPYAVWEERGQRIEEQLRGWGEALFDHLFGPGKPGRDGYLIAEGAGTYELWLSSNDPAFLGLPWELMRDPDQPEPLALRLAGLNRTMPQRPEPFAVQQGETIHVLMVIARPKGEADAGYRSVARPLFHRLQAVAGKVEVDLVRPPTFKELKARLKEAKEAGVPYHILHFDGHGTFGRAIFGDDPRTFKEAEPRGYLLFEGATEKEKLVAAADFGSTMDQAGVPLIVFNACRSGQLGGVGPEATVATRLMQSGAAAVVAMSFAVYVRAAAEFMAAFYEALFEGATVARAVTAGRHQLRRFDLRPSPKGDLPLQDWCVPVHYGRRDVAFSGLKRLSERRTGLSLEASLERLRQEERETAKDAHNPFIPESGCFIGRDREFYRLEQVLGRRPVTLIQGLGGSGKTELAKAFALWLGQTGWLDHSNGAIFHSFEPGVATFGLDGLVSAIGLQVFGTDFIGKTENAADRRALVLNLLKRDQLVLILDNFETVRSMPDKTEVTPPLGDEAAEAMATFLGAINAHARSLVLITSRSPEDWLGEINRLELGGLNAEETNELADHLLANLPRAQERRKERAFGDLLEYLQGHPLSLRLILPQMEQHASVELVEALKGRAPLPAAIQRDPGRASSLDASVAYSLDQLGDDNVDRLVALTLFEGVADANLLALFTEKGVTPVRFLNVSRKDWGQLLDHATRIGLLSGPVMGDIFRMHPALPSYLLKAWKQKAGDAFDAERDAAEQALIEAYAELGGWLQQQIAGGRAETAMALLHLQRRSMGRVLGEALRRQQYAHAQQVLEPLNAFWNSRGLLVEAREWFDRIRAAVEDAEGAMPSLDTEAGALWLFAVGSEASQVLEAGHLDDAERAFSEIVGMLKTLKGEQAQLDLSVGYHHLGRIAEKRGKLDDAEAWHQKSLAIKEGLGNQPGLATSYHHLGMIAQERGKLDDAEAWYQKSLATKEELGDQPGLATSYHHLGMIAQQHGNLDDAEAWYQKSLAISEELGNRPYTAASYHELGRIAEKRGKLDGAEAWYQKSLAIKEALGDQPGLAASYHHLGRIAEERGKLDDAEAWCQKSLAISEELGDQPGVATSYHHLGRIAEERGKLDDANAWYQKSLAIKKELGNPLGMAPIYHQLGNIAYIRGQLDDADAWYQKSLAISEDLDYRLGMALTYGQLGLLEEKRGRGATALDWMVRCVVLFDTFPHPATGPGPYNLIRLTAQLGLEALEASWLRCTSRPLPGQVRSAVTEALKQT